MLYPLTYSSISLPLLGIFAEVEVLLVSGSVNGVIQVFNVETGELVRDLTVHSCQVRGVEWASLHSLITHACETTNGAQGKSELAFINVKTGKWTRIYNGYKMKAFFQEPWHLYA